MLIVETLDYSKTHTKLRLSRDILVYLVNKYDAYLPVTSSQEGNRVWQSVAEEYNHISKGLFSFKDASQLNGKWRNILYHARKFGYPHPLESQNSSQTQEVSLLKRVEEFKSSPKKEESEEMLKRNSVLTSLPVEKSKTTTFNDLSQQSSNGANKVLPKKVHRTLRDISTAKNRAKIQKQRSLLALQFEQERLNMLMETNEITKDKLKIDLEVAKVQLEKEKLVLALCKNEAQTKGVLKI